MLVLMALVAGWPLGRSIWFSLTETNINDITSSRFIGLGNYWGEFGLFGNPNNTEGFWKSDWGRLDLEHLLVRGHLGHARNARLASAWRCS